MSTDPFIAPIHGRIAFIFAEDNFDTDRIVDPQFLNETDVERLAQVAMRNFDPDFRSTVQEGDVLVGGHNFGYGHPHYPPMLAMRRMGIAAVVAESFAPGYWREEMDEGFPQITCPGIISIATRGVRISIDFELNSLMQMASNATLSFQPFTTSERRLLAFGGLSERLLADVAGFFGPSGATP